MSEQPQSERIETSHGTLVMEDLTAEHMAASFDEPEDEGPDEDCDRGLHSWIDQIGRLPASTRCTRCGERYGNPK